MNKYHLQKISRIGGSFKMLLSFRGAYIAQLTFIIPKHIFRRPGYFTLKVSCCQIPFNIFKIFLIKGCPIFVEVIIIILEIQENLFWTEKYFDGFFVRKNFLPDQMQRVFSNWTIFMSINISPWLVLLCVR